jgi:hypothetical protein
MQNVMSVPEIEKATVPVIMTGTLLVPAKKTTCLTGGSEFGFSLDKKTSNATMSVGLTPHYIEKQRRYPWIIVHYHIRHGIVSII